MLKLTLLPGEYLTIGEGIVVQLAQSENGRAELAVQAPREVPILRGEVLERSGGQRPACLDQPKKKRLSRSQ